MKAYTINRYSKKEKFELAQIPEPSVGERDVLVKIHAAGLNPLDSKIKSGAFKLILPYHFPLVLGHDISGVVVRVGSSVRRFQVGDEVFARLSDFRIGGFAESISVNEGDLAIKPSNLSMEEAASLPLVALTAWQALVEKAKLQKGEKVFVQAGTGGVGSLAIQLAKHLGAFVATTVSESNVAMAKELGADLVIDYRKDDFEKLLHDYDFVLNSQDSGTLEKSIPILKPGGKVVSISGPPDLEFAKQIGVSFFLRMVFQLLSSGIRKKAKQRGVNYSFLFMEASGDQLEKIASLIQTKKIHPVLDRVFSFHELNEAMSYMETGHPKGKVVLKMI
ncbi:NADP-dependent oxidoreductase [Leptospira brenneri]|uniref:NADP-dependent oxidoreductase n=1 Tax=Leptospira brenneri TaxID=2023182 RepID=A0A5F1Z6Q5_9LEPT|nr:NADP-dependent oxidoreductase [Leptospira brenneri]TGK95265.1 NADP-dependent oxidoreductase [Leptospira brenneri]